MLAVKYKNIFHISNLNLSYIQISNMVNFYENRYFQNDLSH